MAFKCLNSVFVPDFCGVAMQNIDGLPLQNCLQLCNFLLVYPVVCALPWSCTEDEMGSKTRTLWTAEFLWFVWILLFSLSLYKRQLKIDDAILIPHHYHTLSSVPRNSICVLVISSVGSVLLITCQHMFIFSKWATQWGMQNHNMY